MEETISLEIFNKSNKWMLQGLGFSKETGSDEIILSQINQESPFLVIRLKFIGFIKILYIFLLQGPKKNYRKRRSVFKDLIVETEREYRHFNYFRHVNQDKNPVYKIIKVYDTKNFSKIQRVKLKKIFHYFIKHYKLINKTLESIYPPRTNRIIKLNALLNVANYSYFCALLDEIQFTNKELKIYVSGIDLLGFAAVSQNIPAHYLAHGLIDLYKAYEYPDFSFINVFSKDEADYFKNIFPQASIELYIMKPVLHRKKKVIGFLDEGTEFQTEGPQFQQNQLLEVIEFFKNKGYEVTVKPHPAAISQPLESFISTHKVKILPYKHETTSDILFEEGPSFTFGWHSTALCESLRCGVIPINLTLEDLTPMNMMNMPYPFKERALSWPQDKNKIENITIEGPEYNEVINSLGN